MATANLTTAVLCKISVEVIHVWQVSSRDGNLFEIVPNMPHSRDVTESESDTFSEIRNPKDI